MARAVWWAFALALALGCKDDPKSCDHIDYSICGTPLPATRPDGQPWPTFSQALAEAETCGDGTGMPTLATLLRGLCADGKQFISTNYLFAGTTQLFEDEALVGQSYYTDVGSGCVCPFTGFQGTLASVRCATPVFEALCGTEPPAAGYQPPFSQGEGGCFCDDPEYP